jgi:hypothetical protein
MTNYKHGHKPQGSASPEYAAWNAMRARCGNPKNPRYKRYGARGIKVCDRWQNSFDNFLEDITREIGLRPSPQHSLDRFPNNDGDYEPGNVRWATDVEQANNRRSSRLIELDGETRTLAEWCRVKGISPKTVCQRESYGWNIAKALTTPVRGAASL